MVEWKSLSASERDRSFASAAANFGPSLITPAPEGQSDIKRRTRATAFDHLLLLLLLLQAKGWRKWPEPGCLGDIIGEK